MFYSESLLSRTGPLARVWLSANLERKLSKTHILQSNIETSVSAIVDQGQAPMALRLSGQLLLGVVRIYSRKARYLMDDCHEALMKIKLAFRPGNVDLPPDQSRTANAAALTLPDTLTELDLLAPPPDPSLLLTDLPDIELGMGLDRTLLDWGASQILSESVEQPRLEEEEGLYQDYEALGLDVGLDEPLRREPSIEVGRREPVQRALAEDVGLGEDTTGFYDGLDVTGEPAPVSRSSVMPSVVEEGYPQIGMEADVPMGGMDVTELGGDQTILTERPRAEREESVISEIDEARAQEIERSYRDSGIVEGEEQLAQQVAQQRAKRRKVLQSDVRTEISSAQIRAQQNDRSNMLKPPSFLPRDPVLLALMNMQKSGQFVSSVLGDGRSRGWAPELQGILSIEVIRRSGELKRKRDSGIANVESSIGAEDQLQLQIPGEEFETMPAPVFDLGSDTIIGEGQIEIPADEGFARPRSLTRVPEEEPVAEEEGGAIVAPADEFEETVAPLLHPAETGPISLGTQHAVHLLREKFGPEAQRSPSQRRQRTVLFQDLCPEATTSRADATKMFFETLVLATKDAIKVEQNADILGGEIKMRAKRGLWGAWAEEKAGGEIASQQETATIAVR